MNLDHVRSCNCSICRKRGALNHRVPAEAFRPLTPLTDLTIYQWHTRTAKDYFCPTCGILPFRIPSAPTAEELAQGAVPFTGWVINVRCLEGVILEDIPIKKIFGADLS
ncbi:hypothetical protein CEY04_13360 [Achromobacter sp. HZ28]|nr:hypothetical protein CEY04_13360 [Achromobacter sp. HZ28]OWT77868.1 hypothetical protein CEY05_07855 [Achromobacter sp. HZ34]